MPNAIFSMLQVTLFLEACEHDPHGRRTWRVRQPRPNLIGRRQISEGEDGMDDFSLPSSQFIGPVFSHP